MAKTKISEYDVVAANNTDVDGINIAESCPPSGINNAIREVMAHLKDFITGASGDKLPINAGGTNATTASDARTNLGLAALATKSTVATADIDNNAITTAKITDANVTTAKIADSNITTAKIADDAVTSAKIAENAITTTELNVSGTGTAGQSLVSDGDGSMSWATAGGIGVGQTWQDVKASRAMGGTYTNSTGKPIFISVTCTGQPNHCRMRLVVDGVTVAEGGVESVASAAMYPNCQAIVPNGSTYQAVSVNNANLLYWAELR